MSNEGFSSIDWPRLAREEQSKKSFYEEGKLFQSPQAASGRKLLLLQDWWLVIADSGSGGKRLGVGGYVMKGCFSFSSAYISKRHDASTIETVDGITVKLHGWLNKFRTLGKDFSEEVCDDFLIGFPDYWKEPSASKGFSPSYAYKISAQQARASNSFDLKATAEVLSAKKETCVPKQSTDSGGPSTLITGNSERIGRD